MHTRVTVHFMRKQNKLNTEIITRENVQKLKSKPTAENVEITNKRKLQTVKGTESRKQLATHNYIIPLLSGFTS